MISLFLLAILGLWLAWPYLQDRRTDRREAERLDAKVAQRRALAARMPDSPAAHEALGDALREAGKIHGALDAYKAALESQERVTLAGGATSATLGGTGLEQKIRLGRLEAEQTHDGARFGTTLQTRQQVCRQCGMLCPPQARACDECGRELLVDGFLDTWHRDDHRKKIVRESIELVAMIHIVFLAVYFASWLPIEVQGCLGVSATGVLLWRFLKRIGDGPVG